MPTSRERDDLVAVLEEVLREVKFAAEESIAAKMVDFALFVEGQSSEHILDPINISIRELLSWAKFMTSMRASAVDILYQSYLHGAQIAVLDGLGAGLNVSRSTVETLRELSLDFLLAQCPPLSRAEFSAASMDAMDVSLNVTNVSIGPFSIPRGPLDGTNLHYVLDSSVTRRNLLRILRAMQIERPILLEGPPGVGKSSIVACLAEISGHALVRINLSEHTELADLLGSDLPCSGSDDANASQAKFEWVDGVFLEALKRGDWVLLDELNLAPQTVLEGLNACFDHREEIFIPDIGLRFKRSANFRVFCAQNPMNEGGGRKGLPKSFLSRFTRVYLDSMTEEEMTDICVKKFKGPLPPIPLAMVPDIVKFCQRVHVETAVKCSYGKNGSPWEFNLRDAFRVCEMLAFHCKHLKQLDDQVARSLMAETVYQVVVCRMRTFDDRKRMCEAFLSVFQFPLLVDAHPILTRLPTGDWQLGIHQIPNLRAPFVQTAHSISLSTDDLRLAKYIELLAGCNTFGWPALIVGKSGTGKRSTISLLAKLSGAKVASFPVTSTSDVTELLGSFEQGSENKFLSSGLDSLGKLAVYLLRVVMEPPNSYAAMVSRVLSGYTDLYNAAQCVREDNSLRLDAGKSLFSQLEGILLEVNGIVHMLSRGHAEESRRLLEQARRSFEKCFRLCSGETNASFEWVDGMVVEAAKEGHWLGKLKYFTSV